MWLATFEERSSIFQRLKPNSFLALALIHHICIASNVPLENFVEFLVSVAPQGVLEWVDKKDPMVQFLLRNRDDIFPNYTWEFFTVNVMTSNGSVNFSSPCGSTNLSVKTF